MAIAYGGSSVIDGIATGGTGCANFMEWWAGFNDDTYATC
jgi:hypothetical protein